MRQRVEQIGWVLDHLADLESDFSAIHRIGDMYRLDGPRFLRLAWRMSAYDGVMRLRIAEMVRLAPPTVDGAERLMAAATGDVAAQATMRHALGQVPAGASVVEVPAEQLVV